MYNTFNKGTGKDGKIHLNDFHPFSFVSGAFIESIIHKTCSSFWITQPLITLSNLMWCQGTIPIGGFPKNLRFSLISAQYRVPGRHKIAYICTESGESVSCLGSTVCLCLLEQAPHVRTGELPLDLLLCDQNRTSSQNLFENFWQNLPKICPYDPMFL